MQGKWVMMDILGMLYLHLLETDATRQSLAGTSENPEPWTKHEEGRFQRFRLVMQAGISPNWSVAS
jgi:hypothetical protein